MPLETEIEKLTAVIRDNTVVLERLLSALADGTVTPAKTKPVKTKTKTKAETKPQPPKDPTPEPVPDEIDAATAEAFDLDLPEPDIPEKKPDTPKKAAKPKAVKPNGGTPSSDTTITRDMVRAIVSAYNKKAGRDAAIELMKTHGGAEALRDVKEDSYPGLYAAGVEALEALGGDAEAA